MDIQLHPTDELIEELKRRHPDGAVIVLQHPKHEIRSSGTEWRLCFSGNVHVTLKLASIAMWHHQNKIMTQIRRET
jgi:hypothetical protein